MDKCSADTALRDTNDLLAHGVLHRFGSSGNAMPMCFLAKKASSA